MWNPKSKTPRYSKYKAFTDHNKYFHKKGETLKNEMSPK